MALLELGNKMIKQKRNIKRNALLKVSLFFLPRLLF